MGTTEEQTETVTLLSTDYDAGIREVQNQLDDIVENVMEPADTTNKLRFGILLALRLIVDRLEDINLN